MLAGAQALFEEGDRVRALVVGMNPDCTRISLSTAELEVEDGDMLKYKVLPGLGYCRGCGSSRLYNPACSLQ